VADENVFPADSQLDTAKKKGQMLVIYLPEGSVILDRTNIGEDDFPDEVVVHQAGHVVTPPVTPVEVPAHIPTPLLVTPPVTPVEVPAPIPTPLLVTPPVTPVEVPAPIPTPLLVTPPVTPVEVLPVLEHQLDDVMALPLKQVHLRRRYEIHWLHWLNLTYIVTIALVTFVPGVLSSLFGLGIFVAKTGDLNASINRGDIMITKTMPIFELAANDVFLIRNPNTWNLSIREVASKSMKADMTTISTLGRGGTGRTEVATVKSLTAIHRVMSVIPRLGFGLMGLTSILVKVTISLWLIGINLFVHWRRARSRARSFK
jgi:hypothetical protein